MVVVLHTAAYFFGILSNQNILLDKRYLICPFSWRLYILMLLIFTMPGFPVVLFFEMQTADVYAAHPYPR